MNFKLLCIVFVGSFLFSLFLEAKGCQYHLGDNSTIDIPQRRKRQTSSDYDENVIRTGDLRQFFNGCMSVMVPQSTYDWRTNVDFSVLDTVWFLNNADVNCGFGTGRAGCWKDNLITYLNVQSDLVPAVRTCINQFAEDYSFSPPRNRYSNVFVQSRKKRGSSEEPRVEYSFCLDGATDFSRRRPLSFQQLSEFIEDETTPETCYSANTPNTRRASWPSRFVVLTRTDSPVREPLEDCGRRFFPEDFPSTEVYQDPILWDIWNVWSPCSASCGRGRRSRDRGCLLSSFGSPINARFCECYYSNGGPSMEDESCNSQTCESNDYDWSSWSSWTACSVTCSQGSRTRSRRCLGFGNTAGRCPGFSSESASCSRQNCFVPPTPPRTTPPRPTPIRYAAWTRWGNCPITCLLPGRRPPQQVRFRCPLSQPCTNPDRQTRLCPQLLPCQIIPQ